MRLFDERMLDATKDYINDYQKNNGRSPSLRIIGKSFPSFYANSIAKVQRYVQELCKRGLVKYSEGIGIQIAPRLLSGQTIPIALVGECPCGTPMFAYENIEGTYPLPIEIFGNEPHFMLRAVGNSMINAGINDQDIMIVRKQDFAESGEIVIAVIGDCATAKVYLPKNGKIILRACNDTLDDYGNRIYKDIVEDTVIILGIVDNVIHTPRVPLSTKN